MTLVFFQQPIAQLQETREQLGHTRYFISQKPLIHAINDEDLDGLVIAVRSIDEIIFQVNRYESVFVGLTAVVARRIAEIETFPLGSVIRINSGRACCSDIIIWCCGFDMMALSVSFPTLLYFLKRTTRDDALIACTTHIPSHILLMAYRTDAPLYHHWQQYDETGFIPSVLP